MLDKAIEHGKERRRPYYKAKKFDKSCRNHGSCDWCKNNRLHRKKLEELRVEELLNEENNFDVEEIDL